MLYTRYFAEIIRPYALEVTDKWLLILIPVGNNLEYNFKKNIVRLITHVSYSKRLENGSHKTWPLLALAMIHFFNKRIKNKSTVYVRIKFSWLTQNVDNSYQFLVKLTNLSLRSVSFLESIYKIVQKWWYFTLFIETFSMLLSWFHLVQKLVTMWHLLNVYFLVAM